MAEPAPRPCPFCGSPDTQAFPDGSGRCRACGRAFRGATPVGAMIQGEQVEAKRAAVVQERVRFGILGVVGGVVAFAGIPAAFVIGAAFSRASTGDYVARVINTPAGAAVCGGVSFLVIGGLYAIWAGYLVWRGVPERALHLIGAGILTTVASLLAGQGLAGIVGAIGGILALVGGVLAWRVARAKAAESALTATGS